MCSGKRIGFPKLSKFPGGFVAVKTWQRQSFRPKAFFVDMKYNFIF
jgi:hypothetical protein